MNNKRIRPGEIKLGEYKTIPGDETELYSTMRGRFCIVVTGDGELTYSVVTVELEDGVVGEMSA